MRCNRRDRGGSRAAASGRPELKEQINELDRFLRGPLRRTPFVHQVFEGGMPVCIPEVDDAFLESIAASGAHERFMRQMNYRSIIAVPFSRRSTIAVSTPASANSAASISPVGPAPAITTPCSCNCGLHLRVCSAQVGDYTRRPGACGKLRVVLYNEGGEARISSENRREAQVLKMYSGKSKSSRTDPPRKTSASFGMRISLVT